MSENAKKASLSYLNNMNIDVLINTLVQHYDGETLSFVDGKTIKTKKVIWAAGVTGNIIDGLSEKVKASANRIKVDKINKVIGSENIFALGDIAFMETPLYPKGHPQLANVAINQAKKLARNLKAIEKNKPIEEFEYKDLGTMATIGRNKAVVDLPFIKFKGYIAWLVWMFLHLMLILSVRNKLIIFINWAWAYVTKDSSLRLILNSRKEK
jgi:NADH dehydrogenase